MVINYKTIIKLEHTYSDIICFRYILYLLLLAVVVTICTYNIGLSWRIRSKISTRSQAFGMIGTPNQPRKVHHHIAFLKVHKTGSTTAQRIFLRYGIEKNLTFVVPNNKSWYRNIISINDTVIPGYNVILPPEGKHFDILCFHVVYNRTAFEKLMPNDTRYVGILREPYLQFDSTLRYFKPNEVFGNGQNVSTFLKNPQLYENEDVKFSFTNNRMAFEFGFPSHLFKDFNATEVKSYLQKLDKEFDVVLINEYMDESVVLLRRILNWNVSDILFITLNKSRKKHIVDTSELERRQLYRQYAKLDHALYEYFLERLWRQIRFYGHDIMSETSYFKYLRKTVEVFCFTDSMADLFIQESTWNERFSFDRRDCENMFRSELHTVDEIVSKQYK